MIPVLTPSPKGSRRRTVDDRTALNGIQYVLQTGIPWEDVPQELGFGSGMTCWRRLRDWQVAGVWEQLHLAMLRRLRAHDQIDWERASLDGASVLRHPGGPGNRPQSDRPGKARVETTHRCRRVWHRPKLLLQTLQLLGRGARLSLCPFFFQVARTCTLTCASLLDVAALPTCCSRFASPLRSLLRALNRVCPSKGFVLALRATVQSEICCGLLRP